MMAHDPSPGPLALETETVEAVRAALVQYADAPSQAAPLRAVLQQMALEAHDKSILPEQLLVVLKDIWSSLPNVQSINDPTEQVRLLQRIVTMCIKEYYAD